MQHLIIYIVIAGAVAYAVYRIVRAVRAAKDPCYGCSGCPLKSGEQRKDATERRKQACDKKKVG